MGNRQIENLRIAFVISELRPGGMERVVVHLASGLAKRGISVLLICLQSSGALATELNGTKVQLVSLESHSGKDLLALLKLCKKLKQFQPTVINLHDYSSLPYAAIANILSVRVPLLFTAHGLLYEGFENLRTRYRIFSRFLTAFSAVSDKVAQRHKDYLGWTKPVEIIANGVPEVDCSAELRIQVREELGCHPETCLFLAVGNPRPEKAFEDLIEAVALLRDRIDHGVSISAFMVAVAGTLTESDYCRMLLHKIDELKLQKCFEFLGFRRDTTALYSAADTFVLSSRSEGLPMVILEAMTAGLPVISTRVGGVPDAIGENALLVDAQNPEQFADAMARIMGDAFLRTKLGEKGKTHVENNFGVERMVDEYVRWYNFFCS